MFAARRRHALTKSDEVSHVSQCDNCDSCDTCDATRRDAMKISVETLKAAEVSAELILTAIEMEQSAVRQLQTGSSFAPTAARIP
jgi:hypothetical protein